MITYALKKLLESRGLSSAGIKDIADAIERLTDDSYIRETLAKLIANLADGYSEEDTYPVGDYVFYEDVLYKCVEPVTVGEPFDPDKWVKTTIEEMFINADVSSAVAVLANDIAPMYDPTHAYAIGDYVIYQFGLYQKYSGSTVAENWNSSHWNPVNIAEIVTRLREELSNDILNVKITYDPTTNRATSDVAGTVINNDITNGKTVAAYVNNVQAAVTKTGTGNSYTLSFDAQRVSSYGADEVVLEDILVRYINVTGQWSATVTSKTIPLTSGSSSDGGSLIIPVIKTEELDGEHTTIYSYDLDDSISIDDIIDAIDANKLLVVSIKNINGQLDYYMLANVTPEYEGEDESGSNSASAFTYTFYNALNNKMTDFYVHMSTYNYSIYVYNNE